MMKLLEENVGEQFHDHGAGEDFLNRVQKELPIKI